MNYNDVNRLMRQYSNAFTYILVFLSLQFCPLEIYRAWIPRPSKGLG